MLLERSTLSVADAIAQLAGLQAQHTNSPYIGLRSRLQDFRRDDLTGLLAQRQVVRATLMRATLHLVTAEDYLLLRPALARALRGFFSQEAKRLALDRLVAAARTYTAEQPRTFPELRAFLSAIESNETPQSLSYAVRTHLPLVQLPPAGTLRSFQDERGRVLLDLPGLPLPRPEVPAPARFLPEFDNLVLAHAYRTRVLPEEYRSAVIRPPGRVLATFLVDGIVRGTWRIERARNTAVLVIEPFEPLPEHARDALVAEGERLVRFVEDFVEDNATTFATRFAGAA